jgi:starch synthase
MHVIQSVSGVFWQFDLARELESRGYLKRIYSSFPWRRLRREGVSKELVRTFPWIHAPWIVINRYNRYLHIPRHINGQIAHANIRLFDSWVASQIEECDALVGLSGSALNTGQVVKSRGGKHVCDRGSSHIRYQDAILNEEYAKWGFPFATIDPRVIAREEMEYQQADAIFVPSGFAHRSFVEMGVAADKVKVIPYGVRLERFQRTGEPPKDLFNVMFAGTVSLRKGIPYLLEAFRMFRHPRKRLRLAGPVEAETRSFLKNQKLDGVEILGRMSQPKLAEYMSTSHVLALPSIEDGFGLVMAQAMACGAVVISSENTGGPDLYRNRSEGFIVPIRSAAAIAQNLQELADDQALHQRMSEAAMERVKQLGGWHDYGEQCANHLKQLTQA